MRVGVCLQMPTADLRLPRRDEAVRRLGDMVRDLVAAREARQAPRSPLSPDEEAALEALQARTDLIPPPAD